MALWRYERGKFPLDVIGTLKEETVTAVAKDVFRALKLPEELQMKLELEVHRLIRAISEERSKGAAEAAKHEEEKKRAEGDRLAVENRKQIIAKTTLEARTRTSAAVLAAPVVKAAGRRKESTRSAESADGKKPIQNRGKETTVKKKGPAEETKRSEFPEEDQGSTEATPRTGQTNTTGMEAIKGSQGNIGGLSPGKALPTGLNMKSDATGDEKAEPGGSSPRSKLLIGLGIDSITMKVIGKIPGPEMWGVLCLGEHQPDMGGEPLEEGEAPAAAETSAAEPVRAHQQDIRMNPEGDDTDSLDWEDPPPLFAKDPEIAKVVDTSGGPT
jgi:hypothetical protein